MAEEFENTSQDTQADVKGAGTMLAAPFEIARQDTLLEVQQTVNNTDTTIGDIGDPAGEESLVGLIKNIPETVPTGAVKSVQRGTYNINKNSDSNAKKTFSISPVNPDKCLVLCSVNFQNVQRSIGEVGTGCVLKNITSDSVIILLTFIDSATAHFSGVLSWQVVEFF